MSLSHFLLRAAQGGDAQLLAFPLGITPIWLVPFVAMLLGMQLKREMRAA
jgi:paraquat-inducible protein B